MHANNEGLLSVSGSEQMLIEIECADVTFLTGNVSKAVNDRMPHISQTRSDDP